MANISDSIEQLTVALQQLTAELAEPSPTPAQNPPQSLDASTLSFSKGVETFVQRNRDYAEQTKMISVGSY
jgi:hypothetical protein